MSNTIINLDSLRAESQKVQFLGKEFEIGYIPSGLAIPVIENHNRNIKTQKESDSQEKLLKDNIKSVSIFCSFYEPDFTEEFLSKNATEAQITIMYRHIVTAILKTFAVSGEKSTSENQKKTAGEK